MHNATKVLLTQNGKHISAVTEKHNWHRTACTLPTWATGMVLTSSSRHTAGTARQ